MAELKHLSAAQVGKKITILAPDTQITGTLKSVNLESDPHLDSGFVQMAAIRVTLQIDNHLLVFHGDLKDIAYLEGTNRND